MPRDGEKNDRELEKPVVPMPDGGSFDRAALLRQAAVGATGLLLGGRLAGRVQASTATGPAARP